MAVMAAAVISSFALAVPALSASARVAAPVRTARAAAPLRCHAAMTNSHPRDYTTTGIRVRTAAFAHITTVAHYKTVDHPKRRVANAHGRRTVWYYISGATPGFTVVVDVLVWRHHRRGSCSTSFTPHG
jgi:hypothetical protein